MCSGAAYPLFSTQPYVGVRLARRPSATMIRSRVTLASTLAAATDEHFRSALIMVVTGGVCDAVLVREREQADVLGRR